MTNARHVLTFRRKREGRTNYKKRLSLLKSGKRRLIIRVSNRHVLLQIAEYSAAGDRVLLTVSSKALLKHGWTHTTKSVPASYCAGFLLGRAAKERGIGDAIVDLGLQKHLNGNRACAAIKGAIDGGLQVPVGEDIFPSPERLRGEHLTTAKKEEVAAFAAKLGIRLPEGVSAKKEKPQEKKVGEQKGAQKDQKAAKPAASQQNGQKKPAEQKPKSGSDSKKQGE
jgi:large subunit ribosomal protein L18